MMQLNIKRWLVITLLGLIGTSCTLIKPVEFKSINNFTVNENTNGSGIFISTNVSLLNPNKFKFTIHKADIDVLAEGVNLGKLQIPGRIEIHKGEVFSGDFKVHINFVQLLMAGKNVLTKLKSGQINIQLRGTIDTHVLWFDKVIEIDHKERIDMKL